MIGNLGMGEMLIIAGIALVVIGPEKFPEFAKIALRAFRDFRGYFDEVKTEISKELRPVEKELRQLKRYNPEDYIENLAESVVSAVDDDTSDSESSSEEGAAPVSDTSEAVEDTSESAQSEEEQGDWSSTPYEEAEYTDIDASSGSVEPSPEPAPEEAAPDPQDSPIPEDTED